MSWRKQRVYKCDVCGNEEHARAYEPGRVPWLWKHTGGRRGITICDKCRAAIEWAADARDKERTERYKAAIGALKRKEQEQEQGGERYGGIVGALQTMIYGGPNDGKED